MKTTDTPILPFEATNAYLKGKLKPKSQAQADEILSNCSFSQEAMEGLQTLPPADFAPTISELSKRLSERTGSGEIIQIPTEKLMINFGQVAAIAAALVVVGMAAWVLTSPKIDFFDTLRGQMAFEKTTAPATADTLSTEALRGAGTIVFDENGTPIAQNDAAAATAQTILQANGAVSAAEVPNDAVIPNPSTSNAQPTEEDRLSPPATANNEPESIKKDNQSKLEADAAKLQAAEIKRKQAATQRTLPAPPTNTQQNTDYNNKNYSDGTVVGTANTEKVVEKIVNVTPRGTETTTGGSTTAGAQFVGGSGALQTYIIANSAYPRKLADAPDKPQGKVVVSFDVNEKGKVENVYVVRGLNEILDKKAIAAVKDMPRWRPATQNGKPTKTRQTVSFDFAP
jgi:TonB family protein